MADVLVLTIHKGKFWDHEFRIMLSWFHFKNLYFIFLAICQESRLDIYFPEGAGRRQRPLIGRCGAEEGPWQRAWAGLFRPGRASGPCNLLGVRFLCTQSATELPPSTHCTDEETEARKWEGFVKATQ